MGNSKLVDIKMMSPNFTKMSNKKIDTITIHCMGGQLTAKQCGQIFKNPSRKASSNYGIGRDGSVGLYVNESDRAWTTSSRSNDSRAITIEVASGSKPPYTVKKEAYAKLIALLVDICKRNKIKKLLWKNNKSLIGKPSKQNMTVHRWFSDTDCPGAYLMGRMGDIADEVNKQLGNKQVVINDESDKEPKGNKADIRVKIQVESLNIRSGPGTKYAVVGKVKKGQKLQIIATSGKWGKLKNGRGWISMKTSYLDVVSDAAKMPAYKIGRNYKLTKELAVYKGPGITYSTKKHSELSADGKKHDKNKNGMLDQGTSVTCQEVKRVSGNIWFRCSSGWLPAYLKGSKYIK